MRLLWKAAAWLCFVLPAAACAGPVEKVATTIVMPWYVTQNPGLVAELRSLGFTHATVYLNWNDIERERGKYDFSRYGGWLDRVVDGGLSLVAVLDMGGRPYVDDSGQPKLESTVPQWLLQERPTAMMADFYGEPTPQPDFTDPFVRERTAMFMERAIDFLEGRYPGRVLGYAVGLQDEHEIKYGQTGYRWRDYKESTQQAFAARHGGRKQPVIDYNNQIMLGVPRAEPLLDAHRQFREERLKEATCEYARVIRRKGARAMGYFAEVFTSHDAIYATGIVEKVADCLDVAIIDYNFFDGYSLVPDERVLPMLANYLHSLGYPQILVGAYAEQWDRQGRVRELVPALRRSVERALLQPGVIGYEIGGIAPRPGEAHPLGRAAETALPQPLAQKDAGGERVRLGLLASATNFYVWHGDQGLKRNIHRDALMAAYELLEREPAIDLHVIGEATVLGAGAGLAQRYDAIMVPHQAALPQAVKERLAAFWRAGGALIQDMRLGEFDENGKPTYDWMNEVFGISHVEWRKGGGVFLQGGDILRLQPQRNQYVGYASLEPRPGHRVLATEMLHAKRGILLKGERALTFGFMPQLAEGRGSEGWRELFVHELLTTARESAARRTGAN